MTHPVFRRHQPVRHPANAPAPRRRRALALAPWSVSLVFLASCASFGDEFGGAAEPLSAICEVNVVGRGRVSMEDTYLPRVVACENGNGGFEALKAQAIAARSYAYYKMLTSGSIRDGEGDAVYTCGRSPGPEHIRAVRETRGQVLRYRNTQVAAFFVAGARRQMPPGCRGSTVDDTGTERYVTYNEGRTGDAVQGSSLGWVSPRNYANRGCMSQEGANCLASAGRDHLSILRFYYGADIEVQTAPGMCGGTATDGGMPPPMDAGTPPPSTDSPYLRFPFERIERVTSPVLCNRDGRPHTGTDIGVPNGTPVLAAADGIVAWKEDGIPNRLGNGGPTGFGNYVLIHHGGGRATLYAHLMPGGMPEVGARVSCGDVIGRSGQTTFGSGPHLHFEVRDGVPEGTGRAIYTAFVGRGFRDPYGRVTCDRTPAQVLWVGGRPQTTCAPGSMPMPRDDAQVVSATYPTKTRVTAGASLSQTWTIRNTGSTTWVSGEVALVFESGTDFGASRRVELPPGRNIPPNGTVQLTVFARAPMRPVTARGLWRMQRGGTFFGRGAFLELEVVDETMLRGCRSEVLGRNVPAGTCVQVTSAGCGASKCGWYRCNDGAWVCSNPSACAPEATFAHASCNPAPTCGMHGSCTSCATADGCSWCPGEQRCAGSSDSGVCFDAIGDAAQCTSCVRDGFACVNDSDCCAVRDGSDPSMRCLVGFCASTRGCGLAGAPCATRNDCCGRMTCAAVEFRDERTCCYTSGERCEVDADCCGKMRCQSGRCACVALGRPCASERDCCGGSICDLGVCR
jgi:murein DD-endopeptidase MepM/ murein hydrolase activator NlpD